jgi:hypothetical protein
MEVGQGSNWGFSAKGRKKYMQVYVQFTTNRKTISIHITQLNLSDSVNGQF